MESFFVLIFHVFTLKINITSNFMMHSDSLRSLEEEKRVSKHPYKAT